MATILREKVFRWFLKQAQALEIALKQKKDVYARIEGEQVFVPYTNDSDIYSGLINSVAMVAITQHAQSILFSSEQAQIFSSAHETYFEKLDYKLPFDSVFLQFDKPTSIEYQKRSPNDMDRGRLIAAALEQKEMTRAEIDADQKRVHENYKSLGVDSVPKFYRYQLGEDGLIVINRIVLLYEDWGFDLISWQSEHTDESLEGFEGTRASAISLWKNIIIACIGYINCENVRLERVERATETINAKRERNGKSRLEPYYICRIRGTQHDATATGTGAKHGIRYDVRGHFRRLENKTIWVRAHQRGLQNELYVPKTYLVEKGAKDGRR